MLARKLDHDYEYYTYENRFLHKQADHDKHAAVKPARGQVCNTVLRRRVAAVVMLTLLFAFYSVMRSDLFIQNGYELTELRQQERELVKNIEYMQVNMAKARSPERIILRAEQMDMVMAESNFYVHLTPEKSNTKPGVTVAWDNEATKP